MNFAFLRYHSRQFDTLLTNTFHSYGERMIFRPLLGTGALIRVCFDQCNGPVTAPHAHSQTQRLTVVSADRQIRDSHAFTVQTRGHSQFSYARRPRLGRRDAQVVMKETYWPDLSTFSLLFFLKV